MYRMDLLNDAVLTRLALCVSVMEKQDTPVELVS